MILAALVLQAITPPQNALDAERAFNAAAQARGQWTAFREFAAADATMFVPQPVKAQEWLKDRKDPAKSVTWWPTGGYVSCDGKLAVNTGGWKLPDGTVGFFSTVWRKEADGSWKWIVDGGDALKTGREMSAAPKLRIASCAGRPGAILRAVAPAKSGAGGALDGTLSWYWEVAPDGARKFRTLIWTGNSFENVIEDRIGAPGK